jgi:cytochrome c oxidase assembly factor CtaG
MPARAVGRLPRALPAAAGHGFRSLVAVSLVAVSVVVVSLVAAPPVLAHGTFDPNPPSPWILATAWTFDATVLVPLALLAVGWLWMVDRIDRRHPQSQVPIRRTVAFLAGLLVIAIALQSGIERYDTTLFSIHMVQHLLLVLVAPPLLLLGAPITQLLRAASPAVRRRVLLPFLHSTPMAVISHPVTAWLAFTVVLWGSHFSSLFDVALENPPVHQLEHVLYLVAASLFWFPVIGADPGPRRLSHPARGLYLLLQMPPSSFLAMAVLFASAPFYHHYATLGSPYGIDALTDQQAAAAIMWVTSDVIFISAILLVVAAWMRHDERRTLETEARVDEQRAALAARATALATLRAEEALAAQPGSGEASSSR